MTEKTELQTLSELITLRSYYEKISSFVVPYITPGRIEWDGSYDILLNFVMTCFLRNASQYIPLLETRAEISSGDKGVIIDERTEYVFTAEKKLGIIKDIFDELPEIRKSWDKIKELHGPSLLYEAAVVKETEVYVFCDRLMTLVNRDNYTTVSREVVFSPTNECFYVAHLERWRMPAEFLKVNMLLTVPPEGRSSAWDMTEDLN